MERSPLMPTNGAPWLRTAPCVGSVSPAISRKMVDFPEPD